MRRSFLASFHNAAPRPGVGHRAGIFARPASQTRIFTPHQWGGCIATMRGRRCGARSIDAGNRRHRASRGALFDGGIPLAGVSSTVELTLDDLFGQLNQHLFGSQIRQILKSPHQSQ